MGKAWWGGGWIIATVKVAIKENKGNKVLKENNEEYSFAKTCRGGKGWRVKGEGWRVKADGWRVREDIEKYLLSMTAVLTSD